MTVWFNRVAKLKRHWPLLLLSGVGGGLVLFCGGWILLVPMAEPASTAAPEKKTTLTHAERVVLTAEQMHKAQYRADPSDSVETQIRKAVFGEGVLKSPQSRVTCQWVLNAFHEGRCSLQLEAGGRWSDKAARVVFSEFLQFSRTLCPETALKIRPLVHYARDGAPQEIRAGGYRVRVTLCQQAQGTEAEWWQMLIELWPLS
jgi:hypothetical protein